MKVGCVYKVRRVSSTRFPARCFRNDFGEFEEEWLRAVFYGKVIIERLEVLVEAASEGAHGQIDTVGRGSRSIRYRHRGCIKRQGLALNIDVSASWYEEEDPYGYAAWVV